jgi:hypothetical protein
LRSRRLTRSGDAARRRGPQARQGPVTIEAGRLTEGIILAHKNSSTQAPPRNAAANPDPPVRPDGTHERTTRPYSDATRGRLSKSNEDAVQADKARPRPQHHLAGLYLDEVLNKLIAEIGSSETPFETMMNHIVDLPVNIQRDLLCGCVREFRKLIQATAAREIGENAYRESKR